MQVWFDSDELYPMHSLYAEYREKAEGVIDMPEDEFIAYRDAYERFMALRGKLREKYDI